MLVEDIIDVMMQIGNYQEEEIEKIFNKTKDWEEVGDRVVLFKRIVENKPDSYEARRGLAENLMTAKRFREAAKEWEIILSEINAESTGVRSRLFVCYYLLESVEGMRRVMDDFINIAPEDNKIQSLKDMLSSYLNTRYKIRLLFDAKDNDVKPLWISAMEKELYLKHKETVNITIDRNICKDIPVIKIKYINEVEVKLYPIVMVDRFIFRIDHLTSAINISICIDDNVYSAFVNREQIMAVVEGKEGWLFLDNDTNQSVAQFRGERLIEQSVLDEWKGYLRQLNSYNGILLIVPSKESVFPQFYPYKMASKRSINQLIDMVRELQFQRFVYPIEVLRDNLINYSKTETHYSYAGAKAVFEEMAKRYFGFNPAEFLRKKFGEFDIRKNVGDLGSKLSPIRKADYAFLKNTYEGEYKVYDNDEVNTGKVSYYVNNKDAIIDRKVLFLGDSFSQVISPYFYTCFKEVLVIRVHGKIIADVVEKFRPDYVVAELTERFIISAPRIIEKKESYPVKLDGNAIFGTKK